MPARNKGNTPMATLINSPQGQFPARPIKNALIPPEGPKAVNIVIPFSSGANTEYLVDFTLFNQRSFITTVQALYLDNSANTADSVSVTVETTGQRLVWPAGFQGYLPLLAPETPKFVFASNGNNDVQASFVNVPIPAQIWGATGSASFPIPLPVDIVDPVTFPITASSLPLPTGAATEVTLSAVNAALAGVLQVRGTRNNNGTDLSAGGTHLTVGGSDGTNLRPILLDTTGRQIISDPASVVTGLTNVSAVTPNILDATTAGVAWTPCANFETAYVQINSNASAGTFIFELSNDQTNSVNAIAYNVSNPNAQVINAAITAAVGTTIYALSLRALFFRVRIATALTGSITSVTAKLSSDTLSPGNIVTQPTAANLNATIVGSVSDNAAGTPAPVVSAGFMTSAVGGPTVGTTGRVGQFQADLARRLIVAGQGTPQSHVTGRAAAITTTTETSVIAAQGATLRTILQTLTIANLDTTTGVTVDIRQATAGAVIETVRVPAGSTVQLTFANGRPAAALNTALTVQAGAALTGGFTVSASAYVTSA